jgi:hypothetical protein
MFDELDTFPKILEKNNQLEPSGIIAKSFQHHS